jgi:hypothetical protein
VSSEFNRSARPDGTGSDHGSIGASAAIYSGAFTNGPIVLGNVVNETGVNAWGKGAVVSSLGRQLEIKDFTGTLAYLLRAPSPFIGLGDLSLVTLQGTTLVPKCELSKRV